MTLQGFTNLGDIALYTPGVNTSQGEGHRDAIVFRGSRSTADFFIDGVRDDSQYYRPLYNLNQVEILRGPNALLFGRGGTGGILNRVTKKAIVGEAFTNFKTTFGSFGEGNLEIDNNLANGENSAFRINAFFETLNNHRDFYDGERIGINPTAKFLLDDNSVLDLSYEYVDHERFIDRGVPSGTDGRPVETLQHNVFGDPEENLDQFEAHLFRATLQKDFSQNLKGNFNAFYGDHDKFYVNVFTSSYDQANSPDEITLDGYVDITRRANLILSGNLIGEFEGERLSHTVIFGAEYINTSSDQDRYNSFWSTTADDKETFSITRPLNLRRGIGVNASGIPTANDYTLDLNDDTRVTVDVYSLYVQDEIALSEHWDVVVGARLDRFDIEVFNVPGNETRRRADEAISPRLGFLYKPQTKLSLYGSYSESFLPRSGEQFTDINGSKNQLDPDTFSNLEAGLKWDLQDGLNLTAAVFEIEQSSPQTADSDPTTLDIIDTETTGFEIQLQGQASQHWYIAAGYSYLDGEQVNRSGPTGLRPIELPKNMFSLWNTFQTTEKLGLSFGLTYQDESFINNGNTAVLPSFTRVDAAAFYDISEKLRVQINIENLTDELYFPNAHSTHEATVGAPLNARITLVGRF